MIFQAVQINQSGAVAQLGARVNGIHEVAGSIPASSTKILEEPATGGSKGVRPLRGEHARGMVPLSKSR